MWTSAFVPGSMELKRNVPKVSPRKKNSATPMMTTEEFEEKARNLTKKTIERQRKTEEMQSQKVHNKYLQISGLELPGNLNGLKPYETLHSVDPLIFGVNLQKSISIPVNTMLKICNRALMFDLLEKQKVFSINI